MGRRNQRKCVEDIDYLIQKMKKSTKQLQPLTEERKDLLLVKAHRFVNQWNREKEIIRLLCRADNTFEQLVDEYVIVFESELGKKPEREMVARFLLGSEINRINTGPDEFHQQKMAVCMTELQDEVQRKKDLFEARKRQSLLLKKVLEELQEKAMESMRKEIQKLEQMKKENGEILKRRKIMETVFVELQSEVKQKQEIVGARERQALLMKKVLEEVKNEVQGKQQLDRAREKQALLMKNTIEELKNEVQRKQHFVRARERQALLMKNTMDELKNEVQRKQLIVRARERQAILMKNTMDELKNEVQRKQLIVRARERQALLMKNTMDELKNEVQRKQLIVRARERQAILMKNTMDELKNEVQKKQDFVRAREPQALLMKNTMDELKNEVQRKQEFDFTRQRTTLLKKNVHQELKSLYKRKREFMELFVPRKLFLNSIDIMKEMQKQQNEIKTTANVLETLHEQTAKSTSKLKDTAHSTAETLEQKPARVRRSWRQRIARFFRCF